VSDPFRYRGAGATEDLLISSPEALTPQQLDAVARGQLQLPKVTVERRPKMGLPETEAQRGQAALGTLSGAASGGEPEAPLDRMLARTAFGAAGGLAGGMLGGPLGAVAGASLASGGAEALRLKAAGEPITLRQVAGQAGAGGLGELGGAATGRVIGKAGELAPRALGAEGQAALKTAQEFKVPLRASEVTGSRAIRRVEETADRYALTNRGAEFVKRQLDAMTEAMKGLTPEAQRSLESIGLAVKQDDLPKAYKAMTRAGSELFERVEQLAGADPVVNLTGFQQRAQALSTENLLTSTPAAVAKAAQGKYLDTGGVPPAIRQQLGLGPGETPAWWPAEGSGGMVSFKTARKLESELGRMVGRMGPFESSPSQGQIRALYGEVKDAINGFLESESGNAVKPGLAEAKQAWRVKNALFNEGVNKKLMDAKPEQVVSMAFQNGLTDMLAVREAVTPTTWDAMKIAWVAGLHDQAAKGGQFSPQKFAKLVEPYLKNGQMEAAFGKETADKMAALSQLSGRLQQVSKLAENPSGTAKELMQAKQLQNVVKLGPAGAAAMSGHPTAAIGLLGAIAVPQAVSTLLTSRPGIELMIKGMGPSFTEQGIRLATQLTAQGVAAGYE